MNTEYFYGQELIENKKEHKNLYEDILESFLQWNDSEKEALEALRKHEFMTFEYFEEEYLPSLLKDCYDIPEEIGRYIDLNQMARDYSMDYSAEEFNNTNYLYRKI